MQHQYATPQAFDRALKKAVAAAGCDRGERYRQMLRDRFLCRVFSIAEDEFVLKGGSGLLARIPGARSTRDIDFGHKGNADAGHVLQRLNIAVQRDLGDWCRFELTRCEESLDENGYSRLLKLRYTTYVGEEEKDPILIDLSLDCAPTAAPKRLTPANRVELDGIETCDYLMYPLPDQLADKFCAIMEKYPGGRESSRMKDLVDVVAYASNECFKLGELAIAIRSECSKREMLVPDAFAAPTSWSSGFSAFAKRHGVAEDFATLDSASALAAKFFNPALSDAEVDKLWNYENLRWE